MSTTPFQSLIRALGDRDAYVLLGLTPDAEDAEIKAAYRLLVRGTHSDLGGDDDHTKDLNLAWTILGKHRAEYDAYAAGRAAGGAAEDPGPSMWDAAEPSLWDEEDTGQSASLWDDEEVDTGQMPFVNGPPTGAYGPPYAWPPPMPPPPMPPPPQYGPPPGPYYPPPPTSRRSRSSTPGMVIAGVIAAFYILYLLISMMSLMN